MQRKRVSELIYLLPLYYNRYESEIQVVDPPCVHI